MFNLKLGKKIQPARKMWKGFTAKLQATLFKLKPSTVVSLLRRLSRSSNRLRHEKKPSGPHHHHDRHLNKPVSMQGKDMKPPMSGKPGEKGASSVTSNEPGPVALVPGEENMKDMELPYSKEDEKGTPSGAPVRFNVNEEAKRFIAAVRREWNIERQRDLREYQTIFSAEFK